MAPAEDQGLLERAPAEEFFEAMMSPRPGRSRLAGWLLCRKPPEPVPSQLGAVEDPEAGRLGICCSGGGIRSAAFCLGALQQLQEEDELRRASYLAAVSGGSYIAAALAMVAKTDGPDDSEKGLFGRVKPFAPGSPEEQYLRNRASYLAPTLMAKLYLGSRVVLGLLVNLAFVSLPLMALGLLFAGFVLAPFLPALAGECTQTTGVCTSGASLHLPLGFVLAPLALAGLGALFGLAALLGRWRWEAMERFFAIWSVRLLILAAIAAVLLIAVPYLVEWMRRSQYNSGHAEASHRAGYLGGATIALLTGVAVQLVHLLNSESARKDLGRARELFVKLGKAARLLVTYAAAAVIGPLLLFAVFVLAAGAAMPEARTDDQIDVAVAAVGFAVLLVFMLLYQFVDLTTWSLHPYYKRRLSSVFALRRVRRDGAWTKQQSGEFEVRPASGSDDVGIAIERKFDETVPISETGLLDTRTGQWPTLIICAAANVSDSAATPPGRSVTSFTFSATAVGGPLVGAVPTEAIESAFDEPPGPPGAVRVPDPSAAKDGEGGSANPLLPLSAGKRRRRDLTLPAAMAMSGAAISPSMGKMTRRPLTFLMALANIRLGVWVPNPRWVDQLHKDQHLRRRNRRPRPLYLLWELLGLNRIGAKYLYITDGGHYENLGLVELLRRGCTQVYCLDASGVGRDGADFEAFGEAIALARSELGVEIEFDSSQDESDPAKLKAEGADSLAARDTVTATIGFPKLPDGSQPDPGKLVYVRNAMTAEVPWDVRAHHETDPRFPNDPTIDQLYTDQKFEAYRVLGARAGTNAIALMNAG